MDQFLTVHDYKCLLSEIRLLREWADNKFKDISEELKHTNKRIDRLKLELKGKCSYVEKGE